jgi:hypothetical protein
MSELLEHLKSLLPLHTERLTGGNAMGAGISMCCVIVTIWRNQRATCPIALPPVSRWCIGSRQAFKVARLLVMAGTKCPAGKSSKTNTFICPFHITPYPAVLQQPGTGVSLQGVHCLHTVPPLADMCRLQNAPQSPETCLCQCCELQ